MLKKLLKYDLKYMLKNMIVFYILSIFFAILTRIISSLNQTVMVDILGQISIGCLFSMLCSTLINTIIRSWVIFDDYLYKEASYLTHTLPVTKKEIYESKFLQTLIYVFISFITIVIGFFIAFYNKENMTFLKEIIEKISSGFSIKLVSFIIALLLILFLELFNCIQCGYLGIILGNRKNNMKKGYSVLFGFLSYMGSQIIVLISVLIVGIFNSDVMKLFTSNIIPSLNILKGLITLSIIVYIFVNIIINILCVKLLEKGINIE